MRLTYPRGVGVVGTLTRTIQFPRRLPNIHRDCVSEVIMGFPPFAKWAASVVIAGAGFAGGMKAAPFFGVGVRGPGHGTCRHR